MQKLDLSKRFLQLAHNQLNPDLTTLEGVEQALINWYCFAYNVPPNDDKLLEMTLEELLVLRQMHRLREDPALAETLKPEYQDYESWLKKEMGEDYTSEDEMIAKHEALEQEDQEVYKKIKDKLPTKITTDFNSVKVE